MHIEPVTHKTLPQWIIELEVGDGIGRQTATITDLRSAQRNFGSKGMTVTGYRTLNLPLDAPPTKKNVIEVAEAIALALLQLPDGAKPTDIVTVVCFDGLTAKTAKLKPWWQEKFRYVESDEGWHGHNPRQLD